MNWLPLLPLEIAVLLDVAPQPDASRFAPLLVLILLAIVVVVVLIVVLRKLRGR